MPFWEIGGHSQDLWPGVHSQQRSSWAWPLALMSLVHPAPSAHEKKEWALGPGDDLDFPGAPSGLWVAFLTQRPFCGPEEALPSWDTREPHFGFQYFPFYSPSSLFVFHHPSQPPIKCSYRKPAPHHHPAPRAPSLP